MTRPLHGARGCSIVGAPSAAKHNTFVVSGAVPAGPPKRPLRPSLPPSVRWGCSPPETQQVVPGLPHGTGLRAPGPAPGARQMVLAHAL